MCTLRGVTAQPVADCSDRCHCKPVKGCNKGCLPLLVSSKTGVMCTYQHLNYWKQHMLNYVVIPIRSGLDSLTIISLLARTL